MAAGALFRGVRAALTGLDPAAACGMDNLRGVIDHF
jgi:hypothetical protein